MKDSTIIRVEQPLSFGTLESTIRGQVQEWMQSILDEEVTEFLGRMKSERTRTIDGVIGYRNGYGEPRKLTMSSANNRVEASESAWIGAALRLRTNAAKRFKKADNAACVVWKMLTIAQSWFRRLNAPELLEEVWKGVAFVDGLRKTQADIGPNTEERAAA